ncbi:hypothetical protein APHAL10511_006479 [Amanita phalloides]|nr:hypothetical protein APHAL10511_006479 [Amanita phalloides]
MASNGSPADGLPALHSDNFNPQVAVHSFHPDASPAEKGAAAGRSRDKLQSIIPQPPADPKGLAVDPAGSTVIPTITVEDVDHKGAVRVANGAGLPHEDTSEAPEPPPGAFSSHVAEAIPHWYRVGWREMSGLDRPHPEGDAKDEAILSQFLSEQFYGDWYHNAGIIVFAVLVTHFLTRFGLGWGWLFILLAICSTYYTTSMERVRRRSRDDIQRELVKTRLVSEAETADWMNNFLDRFWLLYEPVLSQSIIQTVDQILSTNTPTFLDSMRLGDFTLGNKAPRIESVRTSPNTDDDVVIMDWTISFTPNDVSNMTPKQVSNKMNPKIVLLVRIGKGLATAAMPILLEDITFKGSINLRLKLMSNFPHVQVVDFCFVERPVIDFVLKPIGGDTFGFDIANIPGLSSFIHDMTHATLEPMMYAPHIFTLNLEQLLSGKPLDAAIGVVKITLYSARGIKVSKMGGNTPDPYVTVNIRNSEVARTKYKNNTCNPVWFETKFFLVNSLDEDIMLNLYDYNDHRKDSLLGIATFKLSTLKEDGVQENITSQLFKDGKENGEIKHDVSYYPVLTPEEKDGQLPDSSAGVVRLVIHQAKELDNSKSMSGELNPLVKLYFGDLNSVSYQTPVRKHTNNPIWEAPFEFLCANKASSELVLRVVDDRDFLKDPEVGDMRIKLVDLLACTGQAGKDWFHLSNCKSGKIRVSAEWKPLNIAGAFQSADKYKPAIGVVRLHLDRATDVKNVEAALGGKSDPYVRVLVNGVVRGRTEVINNNLNPVWDQIIYIPVHSLKESLFLECMDYQNLTKDRPLGSIMIDVSELAKACDDPQHPYESTGKKEGTDKILVERDLYKGVMHYTATFIPAVLVKGAAFKPRPNEPHQSIDADDKSISSDPSSSSPDATDIISDKKEDVPDDDLEFRAPQDNKDEDHGIKMTTDDLLGHQSGIILFNILSGTLQRKARLEVLLDDGYWPCFSTTRATSRKARWDYFGEGFMKELDWGIVWLRLNEADEGEKDDVIGVWKGEAKSFLKSTLAAPQTFTLQDPNDENKQVASVTVEARYAPVPVVLEPRETVNNQGLLRVTLIDGQDIRGVDRSGKSDPFAVFTLNGRKVYKSQVKKETLSPEWNEEFDIDITSRVAADFTLELFDWNQLEQAKSLGTGKIEVIDIEAFQAHDQVVTLSGKHGEKGFVRVNLLFQPKIIVKTRKNTSTFTSAGRAMTQLGGFPVSAGKGVLQGVAGVFKHKDSESSLVAPPPPTRPEETSTSAARVVGLPVSAGKGVLHGVAGVFKHRDHHEPLHDAHTSAAPIPIPTLALAPPPEETVTNNALQPSPVPTHSSIDSNGPPSNEAGTLRVGVISGSLSDDSKAYVVLRVGDREVKTKHSAKTARPEWNESFTFTAGPLTPKLRAWLHEHKTLGKDKDLGDAEVELWSHLQSQARSSIAVTVPLRSGGGSLNLSLEYDPAINPSTGNATTSGERIHRTVSYTSPNRFSIRSRRPGAEGDE